MSTVKVFVSPSKNSSNAEFEEVSLGEVRNSAKVGPEPVLSTGRRMAQTADPFVLQEAIQKVIKASEKKNEIILETYKSTPAYDLKHSYQKTKYKLSDENSIPKRFKRFTNEEIVVVEQSMYERFNYGFTAVLLLFTIILMVYEKKNNLHLIPYEHNIDENCKKLMELSEEEKKIKIEEDAKNVKYYENIKLASDIVKGLSVAYIVGLGIVRIYKRTTI
jgi:hypothetical protein